MSTNGTSFVKLIKPAAKWTAILLASPFVLYALWTLGTSVYMVFVPEYGVHCGKRVYIKDGKALQQESDGSGTANTPLLAAPGIFVVHAVRYRACEGLLTPEPLVGKYMFFELRISDIQRVLDYWSDQSIEQTKDRKDDPDYGPRRGELEDLFYLVWPQANENSVINYITWFPSKESLRSRLIVAYAGGALFRGDSPNQYFFIRP